MQVLKSQTHRKNSGMARCVIPIKQTKLKSILLMVKLPQLYIYIYIYIALQASGIC